VPEVLAAIRPPGQDLPVLLHIVGATAAFGGLLACVSLLALARGQVRLLRLGYFSLLFVVAPGWLLMWLAGEWIYHKQGWNGLPAQVRNATWLQIGFGVADYGGLLFLLTLAVGGIAVLRLRRGEGSARLLQGTMVSALVLALAYVVAVWAMTGKPGQPSAAAAPSTAAQTTAAATVDVVATEFKFKLSKTSVSHGTVVFAVVNRGKIAHDFSIDGKTTPLIAPGKSTKLAVTLAAGTFPYLCTVPGHAGAGMKGTLTVT
jgi:uncharacterized cupredoxin-like copper-binding protein